MCGQRRGLSSDAVDNTSRPGVSSLAQFLSQCTVAELRRVQCFANCLAYLGGYYAIRRLPLARRATEASAR